MIALLCILPMDFTARESCEVMEHNTVYDYEGKQHINQVIFWESTGRCRAWRMDNERRIPMHKTAYFMDQGVVRCITARTVTDSHTMYDPETYDRELWPKEFRRELRPSRVLKR
jgi:hypothetical protein